MSSNLTSSQRAALNAARNALAAYAARHETGEHPGSTTADLAYWVGRYGRALETIAAAFGEDAS